MKNATGLEIECFVHGALCYCYSGQCLLSSMIGGRSGNRGQCVQACRWEWQITEPQKPDNPLFLQEDGRGTYILNSKDLNMLAHLKELVNCGIDSFKIEGRMKSPFYVATVVNAYARAIKEYENCVDKEKFVPSQSLLNELTKTAHRKYTTGFYFDNDEERQYYESSRAVSESDFIAIVLGYENGKALVEMRNRFRKGDTLEILSSGDAFNKRFTVEKMTDASGNVVEDAKLVQQKLYVDCPYEVFAGDILRTV